MNMACPLYYKITETQDLNKWVAQWLSSVRWRSHSQAIALDILYAEMLRYVIRMPHKGQAADDIRKAITLLEDIKAILDAPGPASL